MICASPTVGASDARPHSGVVPGTRVASPVGHGVDTDRRAGIAGARLRRGSAGAASFLAAAITIARQAGATEVPAGPDGLGVR